MKGLLTLEDDVLLIYLTKTHKDHNEAQISALYALLRDVPGSGFGNASYAKLRGVTLPLSSKSTPSAVDS